MTTISLTRQVFCINMTEISEPKVHCDKIFLLLLDSQGTLLLFIAKKSIEHVRLTGTYNLLID